MSFLHLETGNLAVLLSTDASKYLEPSISAICGKDNWMVMAARVLQIGL